MADIPIVSAGLRSVFRQIPGLSHVEKDFRSLDQRGDAFQQALLDFHGDRGKHEKKDREYSESGLLNSIFLFSPQNLPCESVFFLCFKLL